MNKILLDDIFNLPRDILAWVVCLLASWLDMRVIPNSGDDKLYTDYIFNELKDVNIEDIEDD